MSIFILIWKSRASSIKWRHEKLHFPDFYGINEKQIVCKEITTGTIPVKELTLAEHKRFQFSDYLATPVSQSLSSTSRIEKIHVATCFCEYSFRRRPFLEKTCFAWLYQLTLGVHFFDKFQ